MLWQLVITRRNSVKLTLLSDSAFPITMEIWNVHWSWWEEMTWLQYCIYWSTMPIFCHALICVTLSLTEWLSLCNIRNVLTLSFSRRSHKFNSLFHDMKVRMVSTSLLPSKVRIVEVIWEIRPLQLVNFIKGWTKRWIAEWKDCRPNKCQSRIYFQTCHIWSLTCRGHGLCKSQVGSPDGRSQVRDF